MTKKLYYFPKFGQLGNQLAVLSHLIAFANKYNYKIIYPYSDKLKQCLDEKKIGQTNIHFSKLLANKIFSYCITRLIQCLCLSKNRQLLNLLVVNDRFIIDEQITNRAYPSTILITDWMFRFYAGVENQQDIIKNSLAFDKKYIYRPQSFVKKIHTDLAPAALIGIHVRRGDYATWQDGKYYFDIGTYYAKMEQIAAQVYNCVFVICSNEKIDFDNTKELNVVYTKGSDIEDLCVLSKCDYIMGPPSTFSGWAAFLGRRPIFFLRSKDDTVSIDKFITYQV